LASFATHASIFRSVNRRRWKEGVGIDVGRRFGPLADREPEREGGASRGFTFFAGQAFVRIAGGRAKA